MTAAAPVPQAIVSSSLPVVARTRAWTLAAAKLMLWCKHVDGNFRPHAASREAAITAAESLGHEELVDWLRRR